MTRPKHLKKARERRRQAERQLRAAEIALREAREERQRTWIERASIPDEVQLRLMLAEVYQIPIPQDFAVLLETSDHRGYDSEVRYTIRGRWNGETIESRVITSAYELRNDPAIRVHIQKRLLDNFVYFLVKQRIKLQKLELPK